MALRSLGSRFLPRRPPQQGHFYPLVEGRNGSDRVLFDLWSSHRRTAKARDALLAASAVEGLSWLTAAARLSQETLSAAGRRFLNAILTRFKGLSAWQGRLLQAQY
jgi:hypothetical protein